MVCDRFDHGVRKAPDTQEVRSNLGVRDAEDLRLRFVQLQMHEAETQIFGVSHAEVGAYLLGIWGLPYPVIEAVAHHHAPQRVASSQFDVLAALAVSHSLTPGDST